MTHPRKARRIVFADREEVALETFEPEPVTEGTVRLRTQYTLISSGTEGIALRGLFDEDTHWASWIAYPFRPGYSAVGLIEEVGAGVTDFQVGDRVAARVGHASEHVVRAAWCTRVPDGVPGEQACWFGLAKIGLMGAQAARYELGDTVAVIGAGPIGQMSVRWAAAAGAMNVVAVDRVAGRLEVARKGGATATSTDIHDDGISASGDGPRVVVDSTGNAAVFAEALRLVADHGRVVVLGDTGSPASQHLTPDVITRGVTIVGAHDKHSIARHGREGDRRLHELFFQLVATGRFGLDGLTTHTFDPTDFQAAYDVATGRGDGIGIAFDWSAA
jgi:2-desacetyl-2-hydroxyethyl bacteriochlorophyllide A dehydrogenase